MCPSQLKTKQEFTCILILQNRFVEFATWEDFKGDMSSDPFLGAFNKAKSEQQFGHYDDHTQPHSDVTIPQLTLLLVWMGALCLFLIR